MVALKQRLLADGGLLTPGHSVVALDALADSGPQSLAALAKTLDPKVGTAIVTEGLMNALLRPGHGPGRRGGASPPRRWSSFHRVIYLE